VLPIDRAIAEAAKGLVAGRTKLSARDAIHYAVMQAHGIPRILSFDRGLRWIAGVTAFGCVTCLARPFLGVHPAPVVFLR
jgi:predicted nucleic acid-binding protein